MKNLKEIFGPMVAPGEASPVVTIGDFMFCRAIEADIPRIHELRMLDEETRYNSRRRNLVPYDDYKLEAAKAISNPHKAVLMFGNAANPKESGLLRFDYDDEKGLYEISFIVDKDRRRSGVGKAMVSALSGPMEAFRLGAEIRTETEQARALLLKHAGFVAAPQHDRTGFEFYIREPQSA